MGAIARRARASKETLYAWFENKETLYNTLLVSRLEGITSHVAAAARRDPSPSNVLPVLAEDIMALEENGGEFHAVPGYPRVCLWSESVRMLLGRDDALPQLTPVWEKRYLELDGQRGKFAPTKLPLGILYLFAARSDDQNAPRVEKISPREGLLQLVQNTYMNWVLDREQRGKEFDTLCRLVQRVPVRRIVPHSKPEKLAGLCDLILRDASAILSVPPNSPMPDPR
jgi:AcrR family transcriptional regulator